MLHGVRVNVGNDEQPEKFPSLMRYRRVGDKPLLLTGTVSKDKVVLKLERNEAEIIAPRVRVKETQEISKTLDGGT
jgi:hypothetical protein